MESSSPVILPSPPTSEITLNPFHYLSWYLPVGFSCICAGSHLLVRLRGALSASFLELSLLNPHRHRSHMMFICFNHRFHYYGSVDPKSLPRMISPTWSLLFLWPLRHTLPAPSHGVPSQASIPKHKQLLLQGLSRLLLPAGFPQKANRSPFMFLKSPFKCYSIPRLLCVK